MLQPDAGAIAIGHFHIGKDQPVDPRPAAAQHQRGLAFAGDPVEHGLARNGGLIEDVAFALHRAIGKGE